MIAQLLNVDGQNVNHVEVYLRCIIYSDILYWLSTNLSQTYIPQKVYSIPVKDNGV